MRLSVKLFVLFGECVEMLVAEINDDSRGYHADIDDIESKCDVRKPTEAAFFYPGENLAQNSADVAYADERHKQKTGSFCGASFVRANDIERPRSAEADYHYYFADCCECFQHD